MKKIETDQETATAWSPFKVESKEFLQKSYREMVDSVIRSIVITNLGTYSSTTPYVVEGCVLTNSNKDISAGIVFYGGNFYNVSAITSGTAPLEFQLESSADETADPTTFSDNTSHQIHLDYHFTTYSAGAAPSPTFNATALVNLYSVSKIKNEISPADQNLTATSYVDISGSSYTTPNDGKTRTYLMLAKTNIVVTGVPSTVGEGAHLSIYSTSTLDESYTYINISGAAYDGVATVTCMKIASIAPNTVIKLQGKTNSGSSVGFNKNKFELIEL